MSDLFSSSSSSLFDIYRAQRAKPVDSSTSSSLSVVSSNPRAPYRKYEHSDKQKIGDVARELGPSVAESVTATESSIIPHSNIMRWKSGVQDVEPGYLRATGGGRHPTLSVDQSRELVDLCVTLLNMHFAPTEALICWKARQFGVPDFVASHTWFLGWVEREDMKVFKSYNHLKVTSEERQILSETLKKPESQAALHIMQSSQLEGENDADLPHSSSSALSTSSISSTIASSSSTSSASSSEFNLSLMAKNENFLTDIYKWRLSHPDYMACDIAACDEVKLSFSSHPSSVVAPRSWKPEHIQILDLGWEKANFTVTLTTLASGEVLSPLIIFTGQEQPSVAMELKMQSPGSYLPPVTCFTPSHYSNEEVYLAYWQQCCEPQWRKIQTQYHGGTGIQPAALIHDEFTGHLTEKVNSLFTKLGINTFIIPGGETCRMSPLDRAVNAPFKRSATREALQCLFHVFASGQIFLGALDMRCKAVAWVATAAGEISRETVQRGFHLTGVSNKFDGSEDALVDVKIGDVGLNVSACRNDAKVGSPPVSAHSVSASFVSSSSSSSSSNPERSDPSSSVYKILVWKLDIPVQKKKKRKAKLKSKAAKDEDDDDADYKAPKSQSKEKKSKSKIDEHEQEQSTTPVPSSSASTSSADQTRELTTTPHRHSPRRNFGVPPIEAVEGLFGNQEYIERCSRQ